MSYADIHFHILPGIDDGPSSMDESIALAAAAVADGTRTVVATPHVRPGFLTDVSDLPDRVRELTERLDREQIGLAVRRGAELGHDMVGRLSQAELDSVAHGPPGGRWLLVETPFVGLGEEFTAATDELRDRGFAVVVAHPERARDATRTGRHRAARRSAAREQHSAPAAPARAHRAGARVNCLSCPRVLLAALLQGDPLEHVRGR